jgi:tRNA dimethylallyltransferase
MSNQSEKSQVIVILGTTASGKTSLGVALARQLNGEIISADSRQVYRGLDVGSGKDLVEYGDVPHHLIDVANPKDRFSVAEYQKMAYAAIEDVLGRGKQPIIVGGSGQYLEAVVEGYQLKEIKPDEALRADLEDKEVEELFEILKEKNPVFAEKLNNSDKNNKRRLIRYIEVASKALENLPEEPKGEVFCRKNSAYDFLILGLTHPSETLSKKIKKRLIERLENENMIQEVSDLHDKVGLSWERLIEFGLEYKFIAQYLQEKIDYEQMVELIHRASCQFAKRQMTWYKRWEKQGRKICWVSGLDEAQEKINKFLVK